MATPDLRSCPAITPARHIRMTSKIPRTTIADFTRRQQLALVDGVRLAAVGLREPACQLAPVAP